MMIHLGTREITLPSAEHPRGVRLANCALLLRVVPNREDWQSGRWLCPFAATRFCAIHGAWHEFGCQVACNSGTIVADTFAHHLFSPLLHTCRIRLRIAFDTYAQRYPRVL